MKSISYGKLTALALDPIEKKPLRRFHSGALILSAGSFGCNLRCPFCQNYSISFCEHPQHVLEVSPRQLVSRAKELCGEGNIGIALTYNEPLIGFEYARDVFALAKREGLFTVLVTNGYVQSEPLEEILPITDAMNIDLKAFNEAFYESIGGQLSCVKRTVAIAAPRCHVELTTLIIPGENDSEEEMEEEARFIASINPAIPLHLSRFFPQYKMQQKEPTPKQTMERLHRIASKHLEFVYLGNV